jgi:hypothetical protein
MRLYGCACVRTVWTHLKDPRSREAVAVVERYVDGLATKAELDLARQAAGDATRGRRTYAAYSAAGLAASSPHGISFCAHRLQRCALLRCLFNPLHPAAVDPAWLSWNGGTVRHLAHAAYEERHLPSGELDAARLAVLADALEEAGCIDADLLSHLRGPGPHVRGCWALDLILGKT